MKDDLLPTVAHELRTPLASIRALSEVLLQDPGLEAAERARLLALIVRETERLTRLVEEVLDLAKLEAGRTRWRLGEVRLAEVVEEAVASMRPLVEAQGIALECRVAEGVPVVRADRDRVLQVVLNLLSNAIKFCDPALGRIAISIAPDPEGDGVRVDVRDNGAGIRPEDQARLFERFVQLADPVAGKPQGSGLGLAISRHIVHRFAGRLWVDSGGGRGSCFSFTLPRDGGAV